MGCFIKKIFVGKIDEQVHRQFVRFSRGNFPGRAALKLDKKDKIKLGGSFEYVNDFSVFVAENSDAKFSGVIMSKGEISDFRKAKGKNGVFEYEVENINSVKVSEIKDNAYALLLDAEGEGISLKMKKKKLPKPGKSGELKIDDKFCIIEADLRYWDKLKEFFMLPECKKAKISHTYVIEDVIIDKDEKDFEKMRESARKKGKIIRKMIVDGRKTSEEKEFEA